MLLEELFPTRITHSLRRMGIDTLDELREHFDKLNTHGSFRCRNIGKASYEHIEYVLKVELP